MIVVIGVLELLGSGARARVGGPAGQVALAAVGSGARVEVISKLGDDPAGDALLISLARAGVGHVATLRDGSHPTVARDLPGEELLDPEGASPGDADGSVDGDATGPVLEAADVALALRYLTDYRVILVLHPPGHEVVTAAAAAAAWGSAHLVVAGPDLDPDGLGPVVPADAVVLSVDASEGAGADGETGLGPMLGRYAAAVDRGEEPARAFAELVAAIG